VSLLLLLSKRIVLNVRCTPNEISLTAVLPEVYFLNTSRFCILSREVNFQPETYELALEEAES